ncbi:MAG: hypothetical protein WCT25_04595 [Candidatus Paceibacterota bacterium]|jgi:tetratricopeptide (TPR) repeat protein
MTRTKKIVYILIIVVALGLIAYLVMTNLVGKTPTSPVSEVATSTVSKVVLPVPNLDRPVVFPAGTDPIIQAANSQKIQELIADLKVNPNFAERWLALGIYRKGNQDYVGAKEAWEYAVALDPGASVYYGNLANLYSMYLNDPIKAEANYLKAIELDPAMSYLYFQTANFYLEVLKDKAKARAIIEKGIAQNLGDQSLLDLLKSI